jgi:hypothetical protein
MSSPIAEVVISAASFFGGIGIAVGAARAQLNGLSKTTDKNCKDIEDLKTTVNEHMGEINVKLARIETHLGIGE